MRNKLLILIVFVAISTFFSSCGMQRFYIGKTDGKTIVTEKRKKIQLFWLIPVGRRQHFSSYTSEGATGYIITTRYNFFDFLISALTGDIVDMKTVKFKAIAPDTPTTPTK